MNSYLSSVNAGVFYLIVALILTFITAMCLVFLVKSYRAGVKLGIDKKVLKKTITAGEPLLYCHRLVSFWALLL